MGKLKAVLCDMDGVLADSEWHICKAAMKMFEERGLIVEPEDFLPFIGAGEDRYIGGVAEKYRFALPSLKEAKQRAYEIYGTIIKGSLKELPGAAAFVTLCRERGLKVALATSADSTKMIHTMREIGIPLEQFDTVLNGLNVERKKPFPDIYLKAASLLETPPEHCLVVEDAVNGVKAARAAGTRCLGITSSFCKEELSGADWYAPDLSQFPPEALAW